MNILRRIAGWIEKRATWVGAGTARAPTFTDGNQTAAKINVTIDSSQRLAAVYACIRAISETKAALPLHVFETTKGGTTNRVHTHPVADLLHRIGPNPDQTPMIFMETRQQHALSWGNSYVEVHHHGSGIDRLTILDPSRVWPVLNKDDSLSHYKVAMRGGSTRMLEAWQMLHVPNYGSGVEGWSPIALHAESIGIGLGLQRYAGTFFGNAARPSMVAEYPGSLGDKAFERLRKQVNEQTTRGNAHKTIIAEGGMKFKPIGMPPNEAQFVESSELSGEEICRIFRVPPHMVGFLRRATFDNITAQDQAFEKFTMQPWLIRDEQEIRKKLFTSRERAAGMFVKHNVAALLRSDIETRYKAFQIAVQNGWMNFDEVRGLEDMNPIPDGKGQQFMVPLNMQSLDHLGTMKPIVTPGNPVTPQRNGNHGHAMRLSDRLGQTGIETR